MQFIGWASLAYLPEFDEIDLGYRFLPKYWGMGFATEVSHAILTHGFEQLELRRIIAIAMKKNKASIRVMEKVGMEFDKFAPYEPGGEDVVWYCCDKKLITKNKLNDYGLKALRLILKSPSSSQTRTTARLNLDTYSEKLYVSMYKGDLRLFS